MAEQRDDLDEVRQGAIAALKQFFSKSETTNADVNRAKVAASALSSVTRWRQTENAQQALAFSMARELARDKQQLEEYVRVSMPTAAITRALPRPAGSSA
jgi:hypothetical protein